MKNQVNKIKIYYRSGTTQHAYVHGCGDYETAKSILEQTGLMSDNLHWDHGYEEIQENSNMLYFPQPKDLYK
jgi:hypothetical protein